MCLHLYFLWRIFTVELQMSVQSHRFPVNTWQIFRFLISLSSLRRISQIFFLWVAQCVRRAILTTCIRYVSGVHDTYSFEMHPCISMRPSPFHRHPWVHYREVAASVVPTETRALGQEMGSWEFTSAMMIGLGNYRGITEKGLKLGVITLELWHSFKRL